MKPVTELKMGREEHCMKRQVFRITLTVLIACVASFAAEQTWTGRISTSMCNAVHVIDHNCIMNCVKAGEKYVFVNKGQVLQIQNQDFNDLEKHAGHTVKLTGELGSDGKAITVTKLTMAPGTQK